MSDGVNSGCALSESLIELVQERDHFCKALTEHTMSAAKTDAELKSKISAVQAKINLHKSGIDQAKVDLGLSVLEIRGTYDKVGGEKLSVISDAIRWFSDLPVGGYYTDLRTAYFGVKNYDRWEGQRTDCEYGMGPSHGHIVFSVGLSRDLRASRRELTKEEKEAAVYVLLNIDAVQAAFAQV